MTKQRDTNLDLLRAVAILAVLCYHVGGMWPSTSDVLRQIVSVGYYGVVLFFVLSGWLVGDIYWRERALNGHVDVLGFWARRWLRTVPPYFAGMALGYLAVALSRSEPFDVRFLFFGQNYEVQIPYYTISWSLCVEEHFYLLLPVLGACLGRLSPALASVALWSLPLSAPLLRAFDPHVEVTAPFGYSHTATHLVSEGLTLGVAAAHTRRYFPRQWSLIQCYSRYTVIPAFAIMFSLPWWDQQVHFVIGHSVAAACCFVWLAAIAGRSPLPLSSTWLIHTIAVTSYSVYLTHSLAIHLGRRVATPNGTTLTGIACLMLWIAFIGVCAGIFYVCVERPSMRLRDRVAHCATFGALIVSPTRRNLRARPKRSA
jgi:peptidoglycan/LPS O-acetylase OafA/YrhL